MKTNSCIYNQMPSNHLLKKSESMATFAKFSSRSKPCVWERKNVFTCLNTKGCQVTINVYHTKVATLLQAKKVVAIFVGRTMLFLGNDHSLKALYH